MLKRRAKSVSSIITNSYFGIWPSTGQFLKQWRNLTRDRAVLAWVGGVELELLEIPPFPPLEVEYHLEKSQQVHLDKLVSELLAREIAVECFRPRHIAGLFLRPKPEGKFRLIIDLSPLNHFIQNERFKQDNLNSALNMVEKGDYMCKVDLKNAYYSVPVHAQSQPYLAFKWKGKTYMFKRLCFGLKSAPRIFTKIMKPVLEFMRKQGARIVGYIDDFWICHPNKEKCKELTMMLVKLLHDLGFTVNVEKSILDPVRKLVFLGMIICTETMSVSLPEGKKAKILAQVRRLLRSKQVSPLEMASLIGKLEALRPAFNMAPLYYRVLQHWATSHQYKNGEYPTGKIHIPQEQWEELHFWSILLPTLKPQPIRGYEGAIHRLLVSDGSPSGWGMTMDKKLADFGKFTQLESDLPQNERELLGILRGLQKFAPFLTGSNVLIQGDNVTSLSYIRKKGNPGNLTLNKMAVDIWEVAMNHSINLETEHIPGEDIPGEDDLSRQYQEGRTETTEWALPRRVFNQISRTFKPLNRDLFASPLNNQLPNFISWKIPHSQMNAFHYRWFPGDYAFPPFTLVNRVLNKVRRDKCSLILIAPDWPTQCWYPQLQEMLYSRPFRFMNKECHIPVDPQGNKHPLGLILRLVAWPITGDISKSRAFREKSRN